MVKFEDIQNLAHELWKKDGALIKAGEYPTASKIDKKAKAKKKADVREKQSIIKRITVNKAVDLYNEGYTHEEISRLTGIKSPSSLICHVRKNPMRSDVRIKRKLRQGKKGGI